jgi:hypothetical protein
LVLGKIQNVVLLTVAGTILHSKSCRFVSSPHFQSRMFHCLPFFLAKLQAIKISHSPSIEIPRSLKRQYLRGCVHKESTDSFGRNNEIKARLARGEYNKPVARCEYDIEL